MCSEDRKTGKRIVLLQEISADPWEATVIRKEGNDLWVKSAEKSDDSVVARKRVKARGAKGIMKMRTMKSEQLPMVFADSPQGGRNEETHVLTRGQSSRLHKATGKRLEGFMAAGADPSSFRDAVGVGVLKYHPKSRMRDPLVRF